MAMIIYRKLGNFPTFLNFLKGIYNNNIVTFCVRFPLNSLCLAWDKNFGCVFPGYISGYGQDMQTRTVKFFDWVSSK
jgi:hypothetical protein